MATRNPVKNLLKNSNYLGYQTLLGSEIQPGISFFSFLSVFLFLVGGLSLLNMLLYDLPMGIGGGGGGSLAQPPPFPVIIWAQIVPKLHQW